MSAFPFLIEGDTIASVWEDSIRQLLSMREAPIIDTDTGGATIEAQNAVLHVRNPLSEPRISDRYVDQQLLDGYWRFFVRPPKDRRDGSVTVADRMYAWPSATGKTIDQVSRVVSELKSNPNSRRAIIQVWNPASDVGGKPSEVPSGHCYFYFAIRDGALNLTVNSRSVDAWVGEHPNLLASAKLQQAIARRLALPVGSNSHVVMSYHMYVRDLPTAAMAFGD